MCLSPISILNRSSQINCSSSHQMVIDVPCGKCAQCLSAYKMDWFVRIYCEFLNTINNGGYVVFDTLTYNNQSLPNIYKLLPKDISILLSDSSKALLKNLSCFRRSDISPFFKRLRSLVDYYCLNHECGHTNLRYIIFSEYGSHEKFSHRPHYHLLLFVDNPNFPVSVLSSFISKSWKFGRTDGLPYKSMSYVKKHCYNSDTHKNVSYNVCSYVSKYVLKDVDYCKEVAVRKDILYSQLISQLSDEYVSNILKGVSYEVDNFHLQSRSFGFGYYENLSDSDKISILNSCEISLPCSSSSSSTYKYVLPKYFLRRLYYNYVFDDLYKKYRFIPNDNHYKLRLKSLLNLRDKLFIQYSSIYRESTESEKKYIDALLNGNCIYDFIDYCLMYKGRLCLFDSSSGEINIPVYHSYEDLVQCIKHGYSSDYCNTLYSLTDDDGRCISVYSFIPPNQQFMNDLFAVPTPAFSFKLFDASRLKDLFLISNFSDVFKDYDILFSFFNHISFVKHSNKLKQQTFDYQLYLEKRMQLLRNK